MSGVSNPVTATNIKTGSYTGNDTADRAIPHGGTTTPAMVKIYVHSSSLTVYHIHESAGTYLNQWTVQAMDSTNFYVGDAGGYATSANANAVVYEWEALWD